MPVPFFSLDKIAKLYYTIFGGKIMKIKIILEKGEDGYIVAHCPSLKGCWSQGETEKAAIKNIREAIELYIQAEPELNYSPRRANHQKILQLAL